MKKEINMKAVDIILLYSSFNIILWFKFGSEFCALVQLNDNNLENLKLSYKTNCNWRMKSPKKRKNPRRTTRKVFELGKLRDFESVPLSSARNSC